LRLDVRVVDDFVGLGGGQCNSLKAGASALRLDVRVVDDFVGLGGGQSSNQHMTPFFAT